MAVLTTPTTQTTYGSIVDQLDFQKSTPYSSTSPAVYLTRILSRMISSVHSSNSVLSGLEVMSISGYDTDIVSFTLSPGTMIIDSNIVQFTTSNIVSTDQIPLSAPSLLRVAIFASYIFNAATADSIANKVSFTTYLFDMAGNLVSPGIFGGAEKILIASFIIDMKGLNLIPSMQTSVWTTTTPANVQYIGNGLKLTNTSTTSTLVYRQLVGLIAGQVYRLIVNGTNLSQILVGTIVETGDVLTTTGNVDMTFTSPTTSLYITLKVNSTVVGDQATFIGVSVYVDNYHIAKTVTTSNVKTGNNITGTIKTEISIPGYGTFKIGGDSKLTANIESDILSAVGFSTAPSPFWVLDIPKIKPISTSMSYWITEILL